MKKSCMKISFAISISPTAFDAVGQGDWRQVINFLSSEGYDGVELAVREPEKVPVDSVMETLEAARLPVPAVGTGQAYLTDGLSLSSPDVNIRQKAVSRLKGHIQLASLLEADVIIGLIRGGVVKKTEQEHHMLFFKEALKALCEKAENKNVRLLIEPINRYETGLLPTLESVAKVIDEIGSRQLRILMDTFHMNIEEVDIYQSIEKYGAMIGHVHLSDSNRMAPGKGHIDFQKVVKSLKKVNYNGFLSFEILPEPSVEQAARDAIGHITDILKKEEERVYEKIS